MVVTYMLFYAIIETIFIDFMYFIFFLNVKTMINMFYFFDIPFARLIEMIGNKAEGYSVAVIKGSYTSGTSFIDNEEPVKENYNKSRRVRRDLFLIQVLQ